VAGAQFVRARPLDPVGEDVGEVRGVDDVGAGSGDPGARAGDDDVGVVRDDVSVPRAPGAGADHAEPDRLAVAGRHDARAVASRLVTASGPEVVDQRHEGALVQPPEVPLDGRSVEPSHVASSGRDDPDGPLWTNTVGSYATAA
jgi:hypothetical protein